MSEIQKKRGQMMSGRRQKRVTHRERERLRMKRRVAGITVYSIVITIAFVLLLLLQTLPLSVE